MTIYSGFSHWNWWFSIVMLVYQRVLQNFKSWFGKKWWSDGEEKAGCLRPRPSRAIQAVAEDVLMTLNVRILESIWECWDCGYRYRRYRVYPQNHQNHPLGKWTSTESTGKGKAGGKIRSVGRENKGKYQSGTKAGALLYRWRCTKRWHVFLPCLVFSLKLLGYSDIDIDVNM
jgi:hypothetical protein